MKEQVLEPLLRKMRIQRVLPHIRKYSAQGQCHLLDVGCGWEARFLQEIEPYITTGTGIDFKAPKDIKSAQNKLKTISATFTKQLPFEDNSFEVVSLLAVLEHLSYPLDILLEIHRVLKPQGILLGTVPSKLAKPVLEFLSYKLNIVNPDEIRDHKEYYTKSSIETLVNEVGFVHYSHKYFQLGMNNFFLCQKA